MKEKLIELLNKYFNVGDSDFYVCNRVKEAFTLGTMSLDDFSEVDEENTSDIADYLLENGVIVPPCKVGDDIYYINEYGKVCCSEKDVKGIIYLGGSDFGIMGMDRNMDKIGTRYCFLSREEAEKELERMKENG